MSETSATEAELQACADGRLEPERAAAIMADPALAARVTAYRQQNEALHALFDPVAEEPVPERLRPAAIAAQAARERWTAPLRLAAAIVLLILGGAGGWWLNDVTAPMPVAAVPLAREGVAAHRVFVAEVRHPVEVTAADEYHLVDWLSKRLGAPLAAPDLSRAGFALVGGRLLPSSAGPAAQFMYEDASRNRLTLFVRAGDDESTAFRFVDEDGLGAFYWRDRGLGFALIGAVTREVLLELAHLAYQDLEL